MINGYRSNIMENTCVLIDDDGVQTALFCGEKGVSSKDHYAAEQTGVFIEKKIFINSVDYEYQTVCIYEDVRYYIHRIYERSDMITELYLTQKAGGTYG